MRQLIFWLSYLYVPFLLVCLFVIRTKFGAIRWAAFIALVFTTIIAYARFVEPRILLVEHSEITLEGAQPDSPAIKIALFADTHFGIFTHAMPMQRIVYRINQEAPDAVMIAGDFLYYLSPLDIPTALAPLADIQVPIFAVLGNHDVGFPGPISVSYTHLTLPTICSV